ncbi:cation efflux family-domain-containing protein [Gilbertella persicaria]|uniref:cation efflux family-domain-containing protein n=1 Tax=Gilbertella persicaria TaxID=101096 RepID=UPI00221F3AF7|nr:cation efflux family-domain-containing protein [Gilbertella persicaria]KAI8066193.1 cation efflux family-domain-containing protein [Gilbertella persicaria]
MLCITGLFFLAEIIVGYYTGSLSLVAKKTQYNPKYSYGWQRAEILGALVNGVFLFALCFTIFIDCIKRFVTPEPVTQPIMVLITGSAGLVANLIGLFIFHEHGHHHHHHHHEDHAGQDPESMEGRKGHLNMRGIFLHVLGDALGNVGVIASSLFIWLTDYSWRFYFDPAMSLLLTIIIFLSAIPLVRQTSFILLQGVPQSVPIDDVNTSLLKLEDVISVHELHVWQLSDTKLIASLHVLLKSREGYMVLASKIREVLHGYGVHSATIQPEFVEDQLDEKYDGSRNTHMIYSSPNEVNKEVIVVYTKPNIGFKQLVIMSFTLY